MNIDNTLLHGHSIWFRLIDLKQICSGLCPCCCYGCARDSRISMILILIIIIFQIIIISLSQNIIQFRTDLRIQERHENAFPMCLASVRCGSSYERENFILNSKLAKQCCCKGWVLLLIWRIIIMNIYKHISYAITYDWMPLWIRIIWSVLYFANVITFCRINSTQYWLSLSPCNAYKFLISPIRTAHGMLPLLNAWLTRFAPIWGALINVHQQLYYAPTVQTQDWLPRNA